MTTMLQHSFLQMPGGNFSEFFGDVVMQWCNPLTLQPELTGGVGLISRTAPSLEHPNKVSWTQYLATFAIPALGAKNHNFTFTF